MAKQSFTTGQVLTAAQMTSLQANDYNQTVSAKVASYVLVATDAGTRITMSNASATTITVNTALFTAGDTLTITNIGAGVCTITAGTATVATAGSLALNQYDSGILYFTSTGVSIWNGANPGDITGVTAGTGISGGGTSGTVTITNDMATTITAAGDIVVGTGSGTYDNLPIGTTAQVLTADTTVSPYKVKWATPTTGGLTVIATGTLSSTSVVISSIPGTYKHLMVSVYAATWDAANDNIMLRYNSVTTNYTTSVYGHTSTTAANQGLINATGFALNDGSVDWLRTGAANHANWTIYDYTNTTGLMNATGDVSFVNQNSTQSRAQAVFSNTATAAAVTSLTIRLDGGRNMTAGTYTLYGVS